MRKNWLKIVILLAVFAIFLTAFILLKNGVGDNGDTATPTDSASAENPDELDLVDIERDQITKITLKRDEGDIVLSKVEKEVEKLKDKDDGTKEKVKETEKVWVTDGFDVDNNAANNIALAADTAKTTRLIEENPQDLSAYGLDKPSIITFTSGDGKEVTLEIGAKSPLGDTYYVRKSGESSVYTLDSYKAERFLYNRLDLINKNLYGTEALTDDDLLTMSFTKNGSKVFESVQVFSEDTWGITWPISKKVDMPDFQKFIDFLINLRAIKIVEENPEDLKVYGLDKPSYAFDYELGGKNYSLKIGSKDESEDYYATMEGTSLVFTISSLSLKFADTPLIELIDKFIYIPTIYDVEKLVIEIDGRVDELIINADQEDSSKEEYKVNGKVVEENDINLFKKYYQGAIGIMGDKIDPDATPSGKAEIRLTYTMKEAGNDGKIVTVELIPTNDGYGYYLVKNGEYSGMVVGARQLNKDDDAAIRKAYENLMKAMNDDTGQ